MMVLASLARYLYEDKDLLGFKNLVVFKVEYVSLFHPTLFMRA